MTTVCTPPCKFVVCTDPFSDCDDTGSLAGKVLLFRSDLIDTYVPSFDICFSGIGGFAFTLKRKKTNSKTQITH